MNSTERMAEDAVQYVDSVKDSEHEYEHADGDEG